MERLNQIELRLSQLRQWGLEIGSGQVPDGAPTSEEIRAEMIRLEAEKRVLLAARESPPELQPSEGEGEGEEEDSETRDFDELLARCSMVTYVEHAASGRPIVDGPELELQQATGCDRSPLPGVVVPWQMFQYEDDVPEDFADAATNVQAVDAPFRERWIGRIFARRDVAYLGIRMPAMGVGDHGYYRFASTNRPGSPGVGNRQDSVAAQASLHTAKPLRYVARYTYYVEDLVRFRQYESTLRMDLANAMTSGLDTVVIRDVIGAIEGSAANFRGADGGPYTEAHFRDFMTETVDAFQRAYRFGEVRVLMGLGAYKRLAQIVATGGDRRPILPTYDSSVRATTRMPATPSNPDKTDWAIAVGSRMPIPAYEVPVWQGVSFIRDHVTQAAAGVVGLTATMLYQFVAIEPRGMWYGQLRYAA